MPSTSKTASMSNIEYFDQQPQSLQQQHSLDTENISESIRYPITEGAAQYPETRTQCRFRKNVNGRSRSSHNQYPQGQRNALMYQCANAKGTAANFKMSMPKIKDVNKIDRYSRVVFPVAYVLFNAFYWSYYTF